VPGERKSGVTKTAQTPLNPFFDAPGSCRGSMLLRSRISGNWSASDMSSSCQLQDHEDVQLLTSYFRWKYYTRILLRLWQSQCTKMDSKSLAVFVTAAFAFSAQSWSSRCRAEAENPAKALPGASSKCSGASLVGTSSSSLLQQLTPPGSHHWVFCSLGLLVR